VDHDWVVSIRVEDADLKQRSIEGWADEHCEVVVQTYFSHGVAHGVHDVDVSDPVLASWVAYSHSDNIACLAGIPGARLTGRPRARQVAACRSMIRCHV
jgi:hypothetical protein